MAEEGDASMAPASGEGFVLFEYPGSGFADASWDVLASVAYVESGPSGCLEWCRRARAADDLSRLSERIGNLG